MNKFGFKDIGFGLGLRSEHYDHVLEKRPDVGWFEIITENYIDNHKGYWEFLQELRKDYPFVMHGVSLSIGGTDELNLEYLAKIKKLADFLKVEWVSDHLCYTGINGMNTHDLLPIPYTKEALEHIVERIKKVQGALGRTLVIENPSSYLEFESSQISEHEFMAEMARKADCGILLDVNNVYVSAFNHGFNAKEYIDAIPAEYIVQHHLAGHKNNGSVIIDTHDNYVVDEVWKLYEYTIKTKGFKPTMIEWDGNIPGFEVLMEELSKAQKIAGNLKKAAA